MVPDHLLKYRLLAPDNMLPESFTVIRNRAKCLNCGDIIESTTEDDMPWCSCGNLSVSGGLDYVHRVTKAPTWQDMAEIQAHKQPRARVEMAFTRFVELPDES